jgi:hypothetical protein
MMFEIVIIEDFRSAIADIVNGFPIALARILINNYCEADVKQE